MMIIIMRGLVTHTLTCLGGAAPVLLWPGAGAGQAMLRLPSLLQLAGARLAQLGLDGAGPGAPASATAAVVVVAAVRADLLLVQALSLPELGSAVLKPDLRI